MIGLTSLLLPLGVDIALGARVAAPQLALRAAAFALPLLLIALTTDEQRRRLSFLLISAALVLWFGAEFDTFPGAALPPGGELPYEGTDIVSAHLHLHHKIRRAGALHPAGKRARVLPDASLERGDARARDLLVLLRLDA